MRTAILRRRGRVSSVTEIVVSEDGFGTYMPQINGGNPGAGTYTDLVALSDPAPSGGTVRYTSIIDGLGGVALQATVAAGTTSATDAGPVASTSFITIAADETTAANTVTISGSIKFTRASDGRLFTFVLSPYVMAP